MYKLSSIKHAVIAMGLCAVSAGTQAGLIAQWDLQPASGTSLANSFAAGGVTATALVLNNADTTNSAFGNHFYHNGWDTSLNTSKYYEASVSGSRDLSRMSFSLENTLSGTTSYFLRTSLDGFASNYATGLFSNGDVTDFIVDLSALTTTGATFRWYMVGASNTMGFANHELGAAGGGLPDVGLDLQVFDVPAPATLALFGLGLSCLGWSRRKKA